MNPIISQEPRLLGYAPKPQIAKGVMMSEEYRETEIVISVLSDTIDHLIYEYERLFYRNLIRKLERLQND